MESARSFLAMAEAAAARRAKAHAMLLEQLRDGVRRTLRGEGMALTGIITGWVAIGLGLLVLGVFTVLTFTAGG